MSESLNLVATIELERCQAAIAEALRHPLPTGVKHRLRLQEWRNRNAIEADGSECVHPVATLRYDGLYDAAAHCGEMMASVTCMAVGCGSSFSVPVRSDVAREHGGALAHGADSIVMTSTVKPAAPAAQFHGAPASEPAGAMS